ncbi:MAG: cbb3-type cytochrome c oxidase subunit I [Magnetococcales bacterium]|nr:cbb3-type cytochrome c oxidase subunit I [Magnetococcales bacterium]
MSDNSSIFSFPTTSSHRSLATAWLALALSSLIGAGLVVLLIIIARTPVVHDLIPWAGSFKTALVIHVDLSVLVWFLSFAGLFAVIAMPKSAVNAGKVSLWVAVLGALLITFSPFLGEDAPFLNNYVPVLANGAFFSGLTLFVAGFCAIAILLCLKHQTQQQSEKLVVRFGVTSGIVIALLSVVSFIYTYLAIPDQMDRNSEIYFETLFWGPGHILQFTHTQLMMVAWVWLATVITKKPVAKPGTLLLMFIIGAFPAFLGPVIHGIYPVDSLEHRLAFTDLMYYGGGIAPLLAGVLVFRAIYSNQQVAEENRSLRMALLYSLVLFGVGGWIGFMINAVNVTIPAHYHGSIVSITLAYMGVTYHVLPGLGYRRPSIKWANRQLILYSTGSLLHIFGLAWSGGHGVQRKTAGAAQGLESMADKIPMWIMGLGGFLAVVGGVLFLVLAFRALSSPVEKTE